MMMPFAKDKLVIFCTLLFIVALGLVKSATPLGGDQALFAVIAQQLDAGKTLYRDLFDYKQPGIYLFYLLAGKTLGWSDIGIHLFELGYWVLFSLFLFVVIEKYALFRQRYFNGLLPLFIVAVYYLNANLTHLTQLEALINFPLLLIVWLLDKAYKTERDLFVIYLVTGLLIGVVVLCKLVYSPIIFFFLLIHFAFTLKKQDIKYILVKQIPPLCLGFIPPVAVFLSYIFAHQIEHLVADIYFKIPTHVIALEDQVDSSRLRGSIHWFGKRMMIPGIFAIIGVFLITKKESHFFSLLVSWGLIGFVVILMQKTSWWSYHFQLLYVPVGIFAAIGLDFIIHRLLLNFQPKTPYLRGFLLVTIFPLVFYHQLNTFWTNIASQDRKNLYTYDYAKDDAESIVKIIKPEDTIFICGNPRMYLLTSHLPELSTNGWILEYYLDYQWDAFYDEFRNKPPTYLFIQTNYIGRMQIKQQELWTFINREYIEIDTVERGKWYKRISRS
ncbi:MAG: hypothetical protein LZF61_01560 [Nitrosomonas sp.]|nr:MAG: hypothetical protein LZF61_01560 [Nitrosomonas sp.]